MKSSVELWKQYMRLYHSCFSNWWTHRTTTMHIIGCILCAKSCSCVEWSFPIPSSIQCNQIFWALIIIQAMIVTESQIPNCGSKGYCWSFNTLKKRVTCVRENSWNLRKHFDMSVRTKQYLRLGAYVVAIWNGIETYATLARKIILIPSSIAICGRGFSKQNAIKTTCTISWTWRLLMLLCGYFFVGLEWMQWIGYHLQYMEKHVRPKDTYPRLIDSFLLHIKIVFWLFKILVLLKYCVTQNWGDILD